MSSLGNFSTLILNNADFTRFAQKPRDAFWSQLFTIPIGFATTSFVGILVSSSSVVIFGGDPIWNPLDLLTKFLDEGGAANRVGVFFIATAFALTQLGTVGTIHILRKPQLTHFFRTLPQIPLVQAPT